MTASVAPAPAPTLLKLDLGCGRTPKEGFHGVDMIPFLGVNGEQIEQADLRGPWPWVDNSVGDVHASHFLEHLTALQRVHFANELYRVLAPGGKALIITPYWCSTRAYGDPTHEWPPVSEMAFCYWNREWRDANAPHTDARHVTGMFACDFDVTGGGVWRPELMARSEEFRQFAIENYKACFLDSVHTVTSRKP